MTTANEGKQNKTELNCPTCSKVLYFDLSKITKEFPFCSMKCKAVDFGVWIAPTEDDEEEAEEATEFPES